MKPMVDEIANEYSGRLTVATVDIEENQQTVYRLGPRRADGGFVQERRSFRPEGGPAAQIRSHALIDKAVEKAVA